MLPDWPGANVSLGLARVVFSVNVWLKSFDVSNEIAIELLLEDKAVTVAL